MYKFTIPAILFIWYVFAQIATHYAKLPDATPLFAWAGVLFVYFCAPCLFGAYVANLTNKKGV